MEEKDKELLHLADKYNRLMANISLPEEIKVEELLDLVDYYTRIGMDFEAELYKRIAVLKFPTNPEVVLMCAHWEADEGNWNGVKSICSAMEGTKYDEALFYMEKMLRMMLPDDAYKKMEETLGALVETADCDFLFDAAELFRDFGYMRFALHCLQQIPKSYSDYKETLELSAECHFYLTEYETGIQELDQAIDANPFDDYLWAQTGLLQYKKGDFPKALDACEYSLAILKDNPRAEHLKNLLKWQEDENFDVSASSFLRQDYTAMLEFGDLHYNLKDYKKAEAEYMAAGYFCPRGNRDRIQITFRTACCRILAGRVNEGVDTFLSSIHQGFDLWPYAFEILQLLLRMEHFEGVTPLLLPILRLDRIAIPRLEQLATELASYSCYRETKELWECIIREEEALSPIYKEIIEEAKRRIRE